MDFACETSARRSNSTPAWNGRRELDGLDVIEAGEEYRMDPAYFTYYYSRQPLDHRLPPPLFKSHFPGYQQHIRDTPTQVVAPSLQEAEEKEPLETLPMSLKAPSKTPLEPLCEDEAIEGSAIISLPVRHPLDSWGFQSWEHASEEDMLTSEAPSTSCDTAEALSMVSTAGSDPMKCQVRAERRKGNARKLVRKLPLVPENFADRTHFLFSPLPRACGTLQCTITREKRRLGTRYVLTMDRPSKPTILVDGMGMEFAETEAQAAAGPIFLVAARKVPGARRSTYVLSADSEDFDKRSASYLGKCRKSAGTNEYNLLRAASLEHRQRGTKVPKEEIAAIAFTQGTKYIPSQVQVVLPVGSPTDVSLLQQLKNGQCTINPILQNTAPNYNTETQAYEVDFGGRVAVASVKNLQLQDVTNECKPVTLTFGKASESQFVLDFAYPMSAMQAFGVALAAFDSL